MVRRRSGHARANRPRLSARSALDGAHLHPSESAVEERRAQAQGEAWPVVPVPRPADDVGVRGRHDARPLSRPREELRGDREVLGQGCRHLSLARDQGRRLSADDRRVVVCAPCPARCDVRVDGPKPRRSRAVALHADELARPALQPVRARQGAHAFCARGRREPRLARRESDGHRCVRLRRVPRGLRHRRAGRRVGQADRRFDRQHSLARR